MSLHQISLGKFPVVSLIFNIDIGSGFVICLAAR